MLCNSYFSTMNVTQHFLQNFPRLKPGSCPCTGKLQDNRLLMCEKTSGSVELNIDRKLLEYETLERQSGEYNRTVVVLLEFTMYK